MSQIVDPYRYLNNGKFDDLPKLIVNSAGDEFFVSDSAQYYFDDIPGEQNYLLYIPNTGHGLDIDMGVDSQVLQSTVTFVDAVINNRTLPKYSWTVGQDGAIRVETDTTPLDVRIWQADNPVARDFRHAYNPGIDWTSQVLPPESAGVYVGNVGMPATGARAYFIQLTFPNSNVSINPLLSAPYVFTTEIRVKSTLPLNPWPYEQTSFENLELLTGAAPPVAGSTSTGTVGVEAATLAAVASGLAQRADSDPSDATVPLDSERTPAEERESELAPVAASAPAEVATVEPFSGETIGDDELVDYLLDPVLEELLV